jgi:hypothetical protein
MAIPPTKTPEQRLTKARLGVVLGLCIGVISLLAATVGGHPAGWFTAAAMGVLVLSNAGVLRSARHENAPQRDTPA